MSCRFVFWTLALLLAVASLSVGAAVAQDCFASHDHFRFCCCWGTKWARPTAQQLLVLEHKCFWGERSYDTCCAHLLSDCGATIIHITNTRQYWEARYKLGGSSRGLVTDHDKLGVYPIRTSLLQRLFEGSLAPVASVLDLGVGDGLQARLLLESARTVRRYAGIDLSRRVIVRLRRAFVAEVDEGLVNASFHAYDGIRLPAVLSRASFDAAMSLQVIMHILEDELFHSYMSILFNASATWRYALVHGDDVEGPQKNHIRGWRFTAWVARHAPGWRLAEKHLFADLCPRDVHDRPGDALWVFSKSGA